MWDSWSLDFVGDSGLEDSTQMSRFYDVDTFSEDCFIGMSAIDGDDQDSEEEIRRIRKLVDPEGPQNW